MKELKFYIIITQNRKKRQTTSISKEKGRLKNIEIYGLEYTKKYKDLIITGTCPEDSDILERNTKKEGEKAMKQNLTYLLNLYQTLALKTVKYVLEQMKQLLMLISIII